MTSKVQMEHRQRLAYIYIRQSTMGQVRQNQQSTERQYALKDRAMELGWPGDAIRILDGDLGKSGSQIETREDFRRLVADVTMSKVGAIFALEASRLARSGSAWQRLLEFCALTDTIIVDEDGCYDLRNFNDQLILNFKGTMSQAELHLLRGRLLGGKLNKARKGDLRFPLPVGLCHDGEGQIILDPDGEVEGAVRLLFRIFQETGSACGVVRYFSSHGLKFPKRSYGGAWDGKLIWGRLVHGRVLAVLKNPSYAGAYVFGRFKTVKEISPDGTIRSRQTEVPMEDWTVLIKNHHEGYIGWEDYLKNRGTLERNRTNGKESLLSGAPREGATLLQGLLICQICGRRITVLYAGDGGKYPTYLCSWRRREGLATRSCFSIRANLLDEAVSIRALEVLQPEQIEIALEALKELEQREQAINNQWQMRIERADYKAQLAQRRYEEVDPSNRLVAANLEKRWNDALVELERIKEEYETYRREDAMTATEEQRLKMLALAEDLPRLWNSSSTKVQDKKRMLRMLIKDITVEKMADRRQVVLHLRWQGGLCEDLVVDIPPKIFDRLRYPARTVEKVRELAQQLPDDQIVEVLNREGLLSATGKPFTRSMIRWIRYRHEIPSPRLKRPEELTVKQCADRFGVSRDTVYSWIHDGVIEARRTNRGSPFWITIDPAEVQELPKRRRDVPSSRHESSHPSESLL